MSLLWLKAAAWWMVYECSRGIDNIMVIGSAVWRLMSGET